MQLRIKKNDFLNPEIKLLNLKELTKIFADQENYFFLKQQQIKILST